MEIKQNNEVLVEVQHASKKFAKNLMTSLKYGVTDIMREVIGLGIKESLRKDEFWAVTDISFQLRRGECLGLIGHNGAGKSTLLKMLNGLIKPDSGSIKMRGRVAALIELGAGFNPILTGKENIYINGQILGFTKKEIDAKFEEIVRFAEVEEFINMPVQNYSSGMKVRLGFSVAAQLEPDVLIIDEVLAVGDLGFRVKCLNRISEMLSNSAVIFVSHSMPMVARISTQGILMNKGKILLSSSEIGDVIDKYNDQFKSGDYQVSGSGKVRLLNAKMINPQNDETLKYGADLSLNVGLETDADLESISTRFIIWNQDQRPILDAIVDKNQQFVFKNTTTTYSLFVKIPLLRLAPGNYTVSLTLFGERHEVLCRIDNLFSFTAEHTLSTGADSFVHADWKLEQNL